MRLFVLGSFVQACCWVVSRLPKAGETFIASNVSIEAGGKGLNVAICTRRLGAMVDIALGVGQDNAANELLNLLAFEDIQTHHVHHLAAQSGYGAGLIGSDGQNAIAVYPGPNLLLGAEHIALAEADISAADLVYAQFETSLSAIEKAFNIAKQSEAITVLNPSPWQLIPDQLLYQTDLLIVNEVEACELLHLAELRLGADIGINETLDQLLQAAIHFYKNWSGECLVVTLGEHGSSAFTPDGTIHYCDAHHIIAVDTVGAGDAFASGFCVRYLENKSIVDALEFGNACGAIVASKVGVLAALPDTDTALRFLAKQAI